MWGCGVRQGDVWCVCEVCEGLDRAMCVGCACGGVRTGQCVVCVCVCVVCEGLDRAIMHTHSTVSTCTRVNE